MQTYVLEWSSCWRYWLSAVVLHKGKRPQSRGKPGKSNPHITPNTGINLGFHLILSSIHLYFFSWATYLSEMILNCWLVLVHPKYVRCFHFVFSKSIRGTLVTKCIRHRTVATDKVHKRVFVDSYSNFGENTLQTNRWYRWENTIVQYTQRTETWQRMMT